MHNPIAVTKFTQTVNLYAYADRPCNHKLYSYFRYTDLYNNIIYIEQAITFTEPNK